MGLLILLLGSALSPYGNEIKQTILRMEMKYRSARTLEATFLERYSEGGRVVRTEAGTAYFRRPGKMRWEYEAPEKNLFLVDGKTAWFYVPDDHTVMRVPAKQSTDFRTPLALLAGEMKVSRVCAKVELSGEKPESEKNVLLRCVLRGPELKKTNENAPEAASSSGTPDEAVLFEIARETGDLKRLVVRQTGGVEVEFHFENWRSDPPLADALFRFTVPLGVAIVNGEPAGGNEPVKQEP